MQQALRPYATTGVAIAGAALVAVAPLAPPRLTALPQQLPDLQHRTLRLSAGSGDIFTPYVDLITNTFNNLAAMGSHAFDFPILKQFLSDPIGSLENLPNVVNLLTSVTPEITTSDTGQLMVSLPPLLIMALAGIGPVDTVNQSLVDLSRQIFDPASPGDPFTALLTAPAVLLNAFLNGQTDIDVLGIGVTAFNGILVPGYSDDVTVDVQQVVDALALGTQTPIQILDELGIGQMQIATLASDLLNALGLGNQTIVDLLGQIGLADLQISDLASLAMNALGVGNPTVTELVDEIGLGDVQVASLAKDLLEALGIGNPTITGLVDETGLGDLEVADLAKQLLDGLGIGNPTVSDLFDELTGGDLTVGGVATTVLDALGLSGQTPASLLDAMGGGDLTLVGVLTSVLDALGLGSQTPYALIDQAGLADASLANIAIGLLGDTADKTVGDLLTALGMADLTPVDFTDAMGITNVSLGDIFNNLYGMGLINNLTINDFIAATGGTPLAKGGDALLSASMANQTILSILTDQGLADQTLLEILSQPDASGVALADEPLSEFLTANLNTTLGDTLISMGYDNVSLNSLLTEMLPDQSLASLLPNEDLVTLIDQFGLNDLTITQVLNDSGIGGQQLFTLIDEMLGTTTVGSLIGDTELGNTDLFSLIDQLLGTTTVASMLDDSGLGPQHLDTLFDQLFGTATVGSMLTDAGIGDLSLNELVGQLLGDATVDSLLGDWGNQTINQIIDELGLGDLQILNANIGELFGSLPYLFNGLAEQIAEALGA